MFGSEKLKDLMEKEELTISRLLDIIELAFPSQVLMVHTQSFNNNKTIIMSLSFLSNQMVPIIVGLVDANTLQPIEATVSNVTNTTDNLAVASIQDGVNGNSDFLVGKSAGSGNLTSHAVFEYTDANTGEKITTSLTTTTPFEVTEAADVTPISTATAQTVTMQISFGEPINQPTVEAPVAEPVSYPEPETPTA